ncbi:MAG: hypothetical protein ACE5G7_00490 [Candidatus Hydrothermarchaeaceae archaeon]
MPKRFSMRLEEADGIADVFEVVKDAVWKSLRKSRAGLNLGLAELGGQENFFIGAFYPVGSNIIVMNRTPLRRITETDYALSKPYSFHILLHEYLHALGYLDEDTARGLTHRISEETMGASHAATLMAKDLSRFFPNLAYPGVRWQPDGELMIELVPGFDRSSTNYIA